MIEIRLLGHLEVEQSGCLMPVTRPQSRHLLAVLASADGHWVTNGTLQLDLWRDSPPSDPRAALQVAAARLRNDLDDDSQAIVRSGKNGYRLEMESVSTDIRLWTEGVSRAKQRKAEGQVDQLMVELERARRLWRGEPFATIDSSELLENERFRLMQARLELDLFEAKAFLEFGRTGDAVRRLQEARREAPTREDLAVVLMECFGKLDRRSEGLAVAAEVRQRLRDELGISPSQVFQSAEATLLDPGTRTSEPSPAPDSGLQVRWRSGLADSIRAGITADLRMGATSTVVIAGGPRSGRSTLLEALTNDLSGVGEAVKTVRETYPQPHTLRDLAHEIDMTEAESQLAEQVLLLDHLEREAGERGLVLLVDDAELLDTWSMGFLSLLNRTKTPVVTVLAVTDETSAGIAGSSFEATRLQLPPLSIDDITAELSAKLAGRATPARLRQMADEVLKWSGGEPATVVQAIATLTVEPSAPLPVPPARRETVELALSKIDQRWIKIIRSAAVLDMEIDPPLLSNVVGRSIEDIGNALTVLQGAGVVTRAARPGRWVFVNRLTQAIVAEQVGETTAMTLHQRAGSWLTEHGGRKASVARHLLAALPLGSGEAALKAATEGATELFQDRQYGAAAELFELAAHLNDDPASRAWTQYRQALALEWSGRIEEADEIFTSVAELASTGNDPELLASASLAGGGHSGRIGGQQRRRGRLQLAYSRLPKSNSGRSRIAVELAYELWAARLPLDADLIANVVQEASTLDSPANLLARRLTMWWRDTTEGVGIEEAKVLVTDALGLPDVEKQRSEDVVKCLLVTAGVAQAHGALADAEQWLNEITLLGRRTGMPQARWQPIAFQASLLETRGLPEAADAAATEALEIGESLDIDDAGPTFLLHHLGRALLSNNIGGLAGPVEAAADRLRFPVWFAIKGLAALDTGDEASANQSLNDASTTEPGVRDYFRVQALALKALLATRLGREEEALAASEALAPHSRRLLFLGHGGPFLGPVDWFRAQPLGAFGNADEARVLSAAADDLASTSGAEAWTRAGLRQRSG